MSTPTMEELMERFGPVDDPKIEARRQRILRALLKTSPETRQELIDEGLAEGREKGLEQGRLTEARVALRRVLARRELVLRPIDDARIDACPDLATLERWLDQAITARTGDEALR